ncbi:MAG: TonB-dependent receptor domain-containing protein [Pseudohongiellaceae bacterium]|jgi:iron complex outermembrane receptor protein
MKKKSLVRAISSAVCATAFLGSAGAVAQDIEEIVVTGSRISRNSAVDAASPVAVIGGDNIRTSGQSDLGELLRESPALNNSLPANFSAIQDGGTTDTDVGLGLLDLRGLGAQRTLTLVNGRRHVAGGQGTASVDVNSIPTVMVQRVETLTGGASAVYGADAVSGVVNFVLRDGGDFDGIEVTAQTGMSSRYDSDEHYVAAATGFEWADGRGEMVIAIEGQTNSVVRSRDRAAFAGPYQGNDINQTDQIAALTGTNPAATRAYVRPTTNPISSPYGVFNLSSADGFGAVLDAANNARDGLPQQYIAGTNVPLVQVITTPFNGIPRPYNPGVVSNVNQAYGIGDGLQNVKAAILPEQERYNFNLNGSFAINDSMTFFVESKYAYSNNVDSLAGVDFNDAIPIQYDNPYISPALQLQIDELAAAGVIPAANPNDGSFWGFGASRDSNDDIVLTGNDVDRTTIRIVTGIEGQLDIGSGIDYELSYNYGETTVDNVNLNKRIEDRFYAALDSVIDPATGDIVCRSTLDPTAQPPLATNISSSGRLRTQTYPSPEFTMTNATGNGRYVEISSFTPGAGSPCAPFNPFGANSTSQANADFVYPDLLDVSELEQNVVFANLSGDTDGLFSLPGGPIGWSAGVEYREEKSAFIVNQLDLDLVTWDASNGNANLPISGEFDVLEYFAELQAPILADQPGIEFLEVTGAYRYADYSTVGTNDAWSTGLRYSPGFGLTIRGTFGEAVRAPNITELFSPQQPSFYGFQNDPCSIDNINNGSPNRPGNCAALGVPAGYDVNDFITAGIPGVSGGNPGLNQEEATTFTAGIVYEPTFVDGLSFIVDYYSIEIEGAIDSLSSVAVSELCVDLPSISNEYCSLIQRDPQGFITYHQSGQVNLAAFELEGVDFGVDYGFELSALGLDDWGGLDFSLQGTHLLGFDEFQDPLDPTIFESRKGEFSYPEWIVNARASWTLGDLTLGWAGRWEESQLLSGISNQQINANPLFVDPSQTGDSWVHDFNFNYTFSEKISVYGGLNNAFDQSPYLGTLARPAGPRGRYGFLAVNLKM